MENLFVDIIVSVLGLVSGGSGTARLYSRSRKSGLYSGNQEKDVIQWISQENQGM